MRLEAILACGMIAPAALADPGDQLYKLLATDGGPGDSFGLVVDAAGGRAVVGARDEGAAYLYDLETGAELAKLVAPGGLADYFGNAVGIGDGTVIVAAYQDDDVGFNSGSAYLFDAATGEQLHKLVAEDGDQLDYFGRDVDVDAGIAVVGADNDEPLGPGSGSAYLFDAATGEQLFKLVPEDGEYSDGFGVAVAIDGTTVVVGADGEDDGGVAAGAAYVFDATTGKQVFKLTAEDPADLDVLGKSVAVSGGLAVVGAPGELLGPGPGYAYVFDTTTGEQVAKLAAEDGAPGDYFGLEVAISGRIAVVGAPWDADDGVDSGSAYLFDAVTGAQLAKLLPEDGQPDNHFGYAVAIADGVALAGAPEDGDNGVGSGSAYAFDASVCLADFDGDGELSVLDFVAFQIAFQAGDGAADMNGDGVLDVLDFVAFQQIFQEGCA